MTEEQAKRKLTAILSADVKGYSRLMADDEEATVRTINAYRDLMTGLIKDHRGRVVDAKGDNVLAEFSSVVDAVRCAVQVQKELTDRNSELPEHRRMEFRIGINLGDVIEEQGTIYGDGVNVAARLEGLAEAGGICISGTAFDQVKNRVSVGYEYQGKQSVKNIPDPVRVYKVLLEPEAAGKVIGEEEPRPRKKRWAAIAAVAVLAVVAGGLLWNLYLRPEVEPASVEKMALPLPEKPSIAVLPFANMSGDPEQEYFSDGISEEIITALSKTPKLFVIARNSTFSYKGKPVKVQQVAEELGVQYVLEGSVRKSEDRVRIAAQLIDALTGRHLWAERYDRDLKDIFALQDEITIKIISALQVKLTDGEIARTSAKGTQNLEAYLKLLQAYESLYTVTKEGIAQARRLCEEAIALDPEYAAAYGLLGATHFMDSTMGWSKSRKESLNRAFEIIKKAKALDDSDSLSHSLLGVLYVMTREFDKGIEECERAVALAPNSGKAHIWMGLVLHIVGRHEEAIRYAEHALRLDPIPPGWYFRILGQAYSWVGRYEEAIAAFKKSLQRAPNDRLTHLHLTTAYGWAGCLEEARTQVAEVLRITPKYSVEQAKTILYKNKTDRERYLDALRKAGLPETPPLPLPDKPSIAVLPFVNMSGDPEQEYFSDGVTEETITALSKTPKLFVIARNSTFTYKGKPVKVQQVGRELGVKYVLEGSVRKSEDKVRIAAQLVDAATGHHLWAERYDRDLKDIFGLQDEVTMRIITAMEVKLTEGEQAVIQARGTKNLDAYLKYLQAREYIRLINREDNVRARKIAEEIIALDPNYPGGYRTLAFVEINSVWFGWSRSPKESLMRAIKLAKKAIEIEDSSGPHRVLAYTYLLFRKHDEAVEEARKAIEMEPNSADAHNDLGHVLFQSDVAQEAVFVLKKAIRLNPYPPSMYFHNLAWAYHSLGKYEEAINSAKKAVQVNPKDIVAHRALISCYVLLDRGDDARAEATKVLQIDPNFSVDRFAKISPLKNKDKAKKIWDSYRKAGLK